MQEWSESLELDHFNRVEARDSRSEFFVIDSCLLILAQPVGPTDPPLFSVNIVRSNWNVVRLWR